MAFGTFPEETEGVLDQTGNPRNSRNQTNSQHNAQHNHAWFQIHPLPVVITHNIDPPAPACWFLLCRVWDGMNTPKSSMSCKYND
jgi:hypothetical protein